MKSNYLFPTVFKKIGWCLFLVFAVLEILLLADVLEDEMISFPTLMLGNSIFPFGDSTMIGFKKQGMLSEIITVFLSVSLLFISFAREKDEDECIANIRMKSFVWAVKVNTLLLIIGTWFFFGLFFLHFMILFMFSQLLIFIFKYYYELYRFRRANNEK